MTTSAEEDIDGRADRVLLPIPRDLILDNFSLYRNRKRLEISFDRGVFCLAGANGLGKSTFLTTLNYAITGVAPDPGRKFESLDEYYRHTLPYAKSYYSGRIADVDRDVASVRLKMSVGNHVYDIERGFFEQEALRFLQVCVGDEVVVPHDEKESDKDRDTRYRERVLRDTGLAEFEQLVFLQHFLLTFDERRRLLLWDERTTEQALLLAFGVDPTLARRADEWRRKAERAESQARNLQYQATTARQQIRELQHRVTPGDSSGDEGWEHYQREVQRLEELIHRRRADLTSARAVEAEALAALVTTEQSYEARFARLLTPNPERHPLVLESVQNDKCSICAAEGVADEINARLSNGECPLCRSSIAGFGTNTADQPTLVELDRALREARARAAAAAARVASLVVDLEDAEKELHEFQSDQIEESAADGEGALSVQAIAPLVAQYEREAANAVKRRDEWRQKRDDYRALLIPVARDLAQRFAAAEQFFVPRFQALAHRFLGLDIAVYLQQRAARPVLVVVVEGSERRNADQLSESQRYFLDIALRMALVQHMGSGAEDGCLYVDTPEGSLDISYEARAGAMFADFVADGGRLVMTANINTSRLLHELAKACGSERMQLVRMMDWTTLSDVQAEGESLFDEALDELQNALSGSPR